MKYNRVWTIMLCLLAFVVISLSSCGKATMATGGTATKTAVVSSGQGAQNAASKKPGRKVLPGGGAGGAASIIPATPTNYESESILADDKTVYVGSSSINDNTGTLTAFDASRGTVNWQKSLGSAVYVASIAGDTVIAASEHAVYAFDTRSGRQIWSKPFARMAAAGVRSVGGVVYVVSAINNNSFYILNALSITNGSQLWQYKANGFTPDFLGAVNGTTYVVEMHGDDLEHIDQSLTALESGSGKVRWHVPLNNAGGLARALKIADGMIYLTTNYGSVIALHSSTGALAWQHIAQGMTPRGVGDAFPVTITDGVVYAVDAREIIALRASDGYVLWKKGYAYTPILPFIVQPVVVDGVVYIGIRGESVQALQARDGKVLWQDKNITVDEPLVVQAGLVYVNASNTLYTLRAQDGKVAWRQAIQDPDGLSPVVHEAITGENVSIGQRNGMVETFNAVSGALRWSHTV